MEKQQPPPYSPQGQPPPPGPTLYPNLNPPPPGTHTVIVHNVPLTLGPSPSTITCPSCHAQVTTTVQTEATTKTHLFALLLCLFACWPCCCIPYCIDSCQSQNHYCPNCKSYLGKYDN